MRDPEEGLTGRSALSGRLGRLGDRLAWYVLGVGFERWARLGAVAVVPLLLPAEGLRDLAPLFASLAVYVLLTALAPRDHRVRAADLLVSAALIVLSEGQVAPFLLFLIVTVAGPASAGGVKAGLAAGGTLSVVLVATLAGAGALPDLGLGGTLPVVLLLPLVGVTTAAAAQVVRDRVVEDRLVLEEANRLLSSLRAIADDIPGGLDVITVAAAILAEVRTVDGAAAAIVYAEVHGILQPSASRGLSPGGLPTLRVDELRSTAGADAGGGPRLVSPAQLPSPLREVTRPHPRWAVVPIGRGDSLVGALLLGFEDLDAGERALPRLASIASDATLAMENVRLFDGTRARAVEAARRRVAGDLHDGVAQSLAHIRMELELLARHADGPDGGDVRRLAEVAGSALRDLRATIGALRRPLDGDLVAMLERHLAEVGTPAGPELVLEATAGGDVDPDRSEAVLRIAREAVSNALRHAAARHITVSLELDDQELVLVVEDDGTGLAGGSRTTGGSGLRTMRERADQLGGELEVRDRLGGGTLVVLRCPTDEPVPASVSRPDRYRR